MLFARKSKWLGVLLAAALALTALFSLSATAMAADDISFTISVEPSSLTAPGPVTVSFRVATDMDMTEPITLYDPDNNLVTDFADGGQALLKEGIAMGSHTYNVTQEQLDAGKLTYTISYNTINDSGQVTVVSQTASTALTFSGTKTELTVNRTIDPEVVRRDKTVTVLYELYNAGTVNLTSIRVREDTSLSRTAQTVESLAPGERTTVKFTATMGGTDLKSAGTITYKAGTETLTQTKPEVVIPRAKPDLVLTNILAADKTSINVGETVTLTLTLVNNGNITYSNITVKDAKYGEIFTNLTLAPGETLVREKQFTLSETTAFKYTITLPDNTGTTNTESSNELKISVYDPTQVMRLSVLATADKSTVASVPADVRFTLVVTNNSDLPAEDITLYHGTVRIGSIDAIAPAQSVTVVRDFTISQAGRFRFTASTTDALDNAVRFDSNEVLLTYAPPTATPTTVPVPVIEPPVTVTVAPLRVLEPVAAQSGEYLYYAMLVLGVLFGVTFVFFIVASVLRAKRRSASKNAYDHMELGEKRDYTEPAQPGDIKDSADEPLPVEPSADALPSDEILRTPVKAAPDAAADGARAIQQPDENGGYRLTRQEQAEPPAQAAPGEDVPNGERRRRAGRVSGGTSDEEE